MTYRISRISLYNFKSHVNTKLDLPQGTVAILGENGAGKSSILEAIQLALSPPSSTKTGRPMRLLVNEKMRDPRGDPRANFRIVLELKPVEGQGVIEAIVEGGRSGAYILKVDGKLVASGANAYRSEIHKLLGLQYITDPSSFIRRAVIVEQGGLQRIASLMEKGGSSLREEIEAAIGIPDIKAAIERLDKFMIPLESSSIPAGIKINIANRNRVVRRISEVGDEVRRLKDEVRRADDKLKELEDEAERIEGIRGELNARLEEVRNRIEGIKAKLDELDRLERQAEILRSSIRKMEEDYREALDAVRELESARRLSSLKRMVDELRDVTSKIDDVRVEVERVYKIREDVEAVESNRRYYEEYKRLVEKARKLDEERKKIENELARLEAELAGVSSERRRKLEAFKSRLESVSRIVNRGVNNVGELEAILEELRMEYEKASSEMDEERRRMASIEAELDEKMRILEILNIGGASKCPVCGSPLTREHAERLKASITARVEELRSKARESRARIKRLTARVEELRSKVRLVELALEGIAQIKSDLEKLPDTGELESRIAELRGDLERLKAEIENVEREKSKLEEPRAEYVSALRRIERRGLSYDEALRIAESHDKLKNTYDRLVERKNELEEAILRETGLESVGKAEERIREAHAKLPYLEERARRLGELEEGIEEAKAELERLEDEIEGIRAGVDELRRLQEEEDMLRDELNRVDKRYRELMQEKAGLEASVKKLRDDIERLERERAELERALKRLTAGLAVKNILRRLQEVMYKRSLMFLENEMSRILDSFNLDPVRVEIRDTGKGPAITVITRTASERNIGLLSGGEKTSIALAYILALNKMMGSRIGFLALDEPTSELDHERKETLVDILSGLAQNGAGGMISQLIVVTHHEEVIDKMDVVCRVKKERGESRVKCGE